MSEVVSFEDYSRPARPGLASRPGSSRDVFFDRREFDLLLNLYARRVASGEWRDYAIAHDAESCSFAVFRRSADMPLYRVVKVPKLARKQGAFAVLGAGGRMLKRGQTLAGALKFFARKRLALV
jgi:hypothetical protein